MSSPSASVPGECLWLSPFPAAVHVAAWGPQQGACRTKQKEHAQPKSFIQPAHALQSERSPPTPLNQSGAPCPSPLLRGHNGSKVKAHTEGRTSPDPVTGNTEAMGSDRVVLKGKLLPQSPQSGSRAHRSWDPCLPLLTSHSNVLCIFWNNKPSFHDPLTVHPRELGSGFPLPIPCVP